jgi:hypothetical protein
MMTEASMNSPTISRSFAVSGARSAVSVTGA